MYHPTILPWNAYYGKQNWFYILDPESLNLSYLRVNEIREHILDWEVMGPMYVLEVNRDGSYRFVGLENPTVTTNPTPAFYRDGDRYYAMWHEETQGGTPIEIPDDVKERLIRGALKAVDEGKLVGLSEESLEELRGEAAYLPRKPLIQLRAALKKTAGRRRKPRRYARKSRRTARPPVK